MRKWWVPNYQAHHRVERNQQWRHPNKFLLKGNPTLFDEENLQNGHGTHHHRQVVPANPMFPTCMGKDEWNSKRKTKSLPPRTKQQWIQKERSERHGCRCRPTIRTRKRQTTQERTLLQMRKTWTHVQRMQQSFPQKGRKETWNQETGGIHQNWRDTQLQWRTDGRSNFSSGFLKRGSTQTHGPPRYINSVNVGEQSKQLRVPTYMLNTWQGKDVYTRIFIDCRADINCIDIDFAKKHKVNLRKIEKPLKINNVDGSPNNTGAVKYQATFFFKIGTVVHNKTFYTMKCGRDNLILGLPWLNKINPKIDWEKKHIEIDDDKPFNAVRARTTLFLLF